MSRLPKAPKKLTAKTVNDISMHFFKQDKVADNLMYIEENKSLYLYDEEKNFYKLLERDTLYQDIFNFIKDGITTGRTNDENLARTLEYQLTMLATHRQKFMRSDYISFNDQLFSLKTFECEPHNKSKFSIIHVDCDYVQTQQNSEQWEQFLHEVLVFPKKLTPEEREQDQSYEHDPQLYNLLQEMMGWYLLDDLTPHKAFFLIGEGRNGKGVFTKVLSQIIGNHNVANMSLELLSKNSFAIANLIGKKINMCSEEESRYITSDLFKSLVAGDRLTAERKFKSPFEFTPHTKFLFTTNKMPHFNDAGIAIIERLAFIPFNRYFSKMARIPNFEKKLIKELPAIVGWALKGAKRIQENNYIFSEAQQQLASIATFEESVSSVIQFIRENYIQTKEQMPYNFYRTTDLYEVYKSWCIEEGRKPLGRNKMLSEIGQHWGERKAGITSSDERGRGWYIEKKEEESYVFTSPELDDKFHDAL
jgi:P4 family phage/plasmid primase-like protien|tara:strand:- start:490 stop:1920 length:1431 start_codon:yes stop_codon:yes gene_type:complete